ncbi:AAA family ATPase [uncultured Psychromonas sp.]|uniref:AAA family ATPase n=1 Tax=uncultured Psychromonas sp. TaxID=173974 RepID=UPI002610ABB7|nr:AAA family ATPase [uncultured Psychromonas sp.]
MVERTLISLPSQLQLIERLQHLIYLSSSLIFVSGEAGAGKSTLTENLSNTLPADLKQVYVSLVNEPTAAKLRQQIISQLFDKALFNAEDKLLDSILRLQQAENRSLNRLIIIDNADHLPADFIAELCELFSDNNLAQDNTLNVLLLTEQTATEQYLDYIDTHLASRIKDFLNHVELTLPVLNTQEANALLQHNFQQVDYHAKLQHQDALNQQLRLCNGNPQKIIKLADDLSQGLLKPITTSWVQTRLPAIALMLFLVAIVSAIAVYLYPKFIPNKSLSEAENAQAPIDSTYIALEEIKEVEGMPEEHNSSEVNAVEDNEEDSEDSKTVAADTQAPLNEGPEKLAASWADLDIDVIDNQSQVGLSDATEKRVVISGQQLLELSVAIEAKDADVNEQVLLEDDSYTPLTAPSITTETSVEASTGKVNQTENEQQVPLLLRLPVDNENNLVENETITDNLNDSKALLNSEQTATTEQETVLDKQYTIETVSDASSEDLVNDNELENKALPLSIAEQLPVNINTAAVETAAQPVNNINTSVKQESLFTDSETLFAKDASHYTLQLSGMASREYLIEFQNQYRSSLENIYIYQTVRQAKPWYVIIYGDYDSVKSAQLAAKNLPNAFRNMPSWVKKWQVVHNDLRLNNE